MMDPCAHCEEMMQPYLDRILTHEEMAELYADTKRTLLGLHAGSPPHAPSVQVPSAGT